MNNSNITSGGNDILINEENFPDPCFREWLLEQDFVQNGIIAKEQIAEITEINVSCKKIGSLEGIHFFTALTTLRCDRNKLARLDISNNTALRKLRCWFNELTSLDISNNTALTELVCDTNQLTSLDVSNNTALTELRCDFNQLTSLDVSNNTALRELRCDNTQLTRLDLSNNTALTMLFCDNNDLTSLDVSKNTALRELSCDNTQLTSLDVTNNMAFDWLECHNNNIKGTNMDALISSLPNTDGKIYIYDSTSETEGNVCTETQVAAIREKGWTPYYLKTAKNS